MISSRTLLIQKNAIQFLPHPLVNNGTVDTLNMCYNSPELHSVGQNNEYLRVYGTEKGTAPTLLELSAKVVLNMTAKAPGSSLPRRVFPYFLPNVLPAYLMEYLYKGKKCGKCRSMTCRYMFRIDSARSRTLGNQVSSDSQMVRILAVVCTDHDIDQPISRRQPI